MMGRMTSTLTVATMMTIFFLPALDAAWFQVRRTVAPELDFAPAAVA